MCKTLSICLFHAFEDPLSRASFQLIFNHSVQSCENGLKSLSMATSDFGKPHPVFATTVDAPLSLRWSFKTISKLVFCLNIRWVMALLAWCTLQAIQEAFYYRYSYWSHAKPTAERSLMLHMLLLSGQEWFQRVDLNHDKLFKIYTDLGISSREAYFFTI